MSPGGRAVRRLLVVAAGMATLLTTPSSAAPGPQVVDPANDANGGSYWAGSPDTVTPAGSQSYADVTGVRFATTRTTKRVGRRTVTTVTGFTVTMTLTAAPVPPGETTGIYRVFALGPKCIVGSEHYTRALPDATQPRDVFFDTCQGALRRTPLKPPTINGATIMWIVPLTAVPKDTKVGIGATLTDLHFEVYIAHRATCAQSRPGEEREPCAMHLDGARPQGSFVIR